MSEEPDEEAQLLENWQACAPDERPVWLRSKTPQQLLLLLGALKTRADDQLISRPQAADELSRQALQIAELYPHDQQLQGRAAWARGNWCAYHDAAEAATYYHAAIEAYRTLGDTLNVARLHGNLVFVWSDLGLFDQAEQAYAQAHSIYQTLGEAALPYLQALEQNYGWLHYTRADYQGALAAYDRALVLAQALKRAEIEAEIKVNQALALGMLGALAACQAALLEARALAAAHDQALTIARIDRNLGVLYTTQGRPAQALQAFQAARSRFAELDNQQEVGLSLFWEATLLERLGALRQARQQYRAAEQQFRSAQMRPYLARALLRRAIATRLYGYYQEALGLLDEAEEAWAALDQPAGKTQVLLERAALALAHQDLALARALLERPGPALEMPALQAQHQLLSAEAAALSWHQSGGVTARRQAAQAYQNALACAEQLGDRWLLRSALAGLGRLALPDDPAAAVANLEAAARLDDELRQTLSVEELKASYQTQSSQILPLLAQLAIDSPWRALQLSWRAKGSALLELAVRSARDDTEPPELAQVREQLAALRWSIVQAGTPLGNELLLEQEHEALRELEERLALLRRARNQGLPDAAQSQLQDARALIARLEADTLIEYLACERGLLAIRVDGDGSCTTTWLEDLAGLDDMQDQLQLALHDFLCLAPAQWEAEPETWLEEVRPLLQSCYERLIAPLGELPAGGHLLIAPCAPLYLLPFAALWDGERYLAERYLIEHIPSGALLAAPALEAVALAPPLIVASTAEGQLPHVAQEARAIRAAFPQSTCLVDDPASLAALGLLQPPPRLLHLAAHSLLRHDAPLLSALRLPGGMLSVEHCYQLNLRGTSLVTLSGCTTASGLDSGGSLLAFQSAFLVAGARRVISSLWQLDDAAAAHAMDLLYRLLSTGLEPPAALRAAQQQLIDDPAHCHPALWAAFICTRR